MFRAQAVKYYKPSEALITFNMFKVVNLTKHLFQTPAYVPFLKILFLIFLYATIRTLNSTKGFCRKYVTLLFLGKAANCQTACKYEIQFIPLSQYSFECMTFLI